MRVHLVLDETSFFQPEFLRDILLGLDKRDIISGVSILDVPMKKSLLHKCIMRNFFNVGFLSLLSLFLIASSHSITNVGFGFGLPMQPHSVQGIARRFGIKYRVTKKIMSEESLDWIAQQKPDIILASCSQIFKKPLLEIPKIGCINRHSSLLPAYGGVFPVIQALLHGEKMIGCSIHLMTQKIDGGKLVAQSTVPVLPGDTVYSLYKKSYIDCGILALEAFDKLRDIPDREALATRDFGVPVRAAKSYFGVPSKEDWRNYRILGFDFADGNLIHLITGMG